MFEEKNTPATHSPLSNTDLAFERTALAHERTLMAWIRTAMSLISFGFTIYKFFQGTSHTAEGSGRWLSPRFVGMTMISFGLLSLLLALLATPVTYSLFDGLGRRIRKLMPWREQTVGVHAAPAVT